MCVIDWAIKNLYAILVDMFEFALILLLISALDLMVAIAAFINIYLNMYLNLSTCICNSIARTRRCWDAPQLHWLMDGS